MTSTLSGGPASPPLSAALPILQTLAPVDRLSVRDIRLRSGADTWPEGRLGRLLDTLRERGLIVQDGIDFYALSIAGRREVSRG
jgi:DNA-binding IclR family transcriptional regulator